MQSDVKQEAEDPHQQSPARAISVIEPRKAAKTSLVQSMRDWLRSALGARDANIREALEEVLEEHEEEASQLAPQEKAMLHNVLSFGDLTVHDIMIPRTDILAVAADIKLGELKRHINEQRHTRIPVYRDTLDHVAGFLHIKDLLPMISGDAPFDLNAAIRPMLFVPPSMRIIDLLVKMRRQGSHMAIVVDEYGGTDGLVTLEDVFEEIVGEIHDEHDEEDGANELKRVSDKVVEADARVRVERLEEALGLNLVSDSEDMEFDTLGGLIFSQLGRVPAKGEQVAHDSGIMFEIMDADPRRIKRVRITGAEQVAEMV